LEATIRNLIHVLHSDGVSAATDYVNLNVTPLVQKMRAALENAESLESNCRALLCAASFEAQPIALPAAVHALPTASASGAKGTVKDAVLMEAEQLALQSENRTVRLKDLVKRLAEANIQLDSSRPATTAAIWLSRSERWARVRPSEFRLK